MTQARNIHKWIHEQADAPHDAETCACINSRQVQHVTKTRNFITSYISKTKAGATVLVKCVVPSLLKFCVKFCECVNLENLSSSSSPPPLDREPSCSSAYLDCRRHMRIKLGTCHLLMPTCALCSTVATCSSPHVHHARQLPPAEARMCIKLGTCHPLKPTCALCSTVATC